MFHFYLRRIRARRRTKSSSNFCESRVPRLTVRSRSADSRFRWPELEPKEELLVQEREFANLLTCVMTVTDKTKETKTLPVSENYVTEIPKGIRLRKNGKIEESIKYLSSLGKFGYFHLAVSLFVQKKFSKSLQFLNYLVDDGCENWKVWCLKGENHIKLGNRPEAIANLEKSLTFYESIVTLFRLCQLFYDEEDEKWKFYLEKIFDKDPYFRPGRIFRASKFRNYPDDALRDCEVILQQNESDLEFRFLRAQALQAKRKFDEALTEFLYLERKSYPGATRAVEILHIRKNRKISQFDFSNDDITILLNEMKRLTSEFSTRAIEAAIKVGEVDLLLLMAKRNVMKKPLETIFMLENGEFSSYVPKERKIESKLVSGSTFYFRFLV